MESSRDWIELEEKYGSHNYKPMPVVLSHGEGVWVTDVDGKRYLDMLSAYSALNFGHRHPRLLDAMRRQMDRLTLTSRAFFNDQLGPWYKKVTEFCALDLAIPMNSGTEAVETALKVARKWAYLEKKVPANQAEIIVCHNNFHGRSIAIISFSTEPENRDGFGPLTPGFRSIPYGDASALERAITPHTAAFLVEPIQGEGGVIIPPTGYLKEVREICTRHNVLLMVDEIQTGLGRTGRCFCYQHEESQPDVVILGKALGGGLYPISAVVTRQDILGLLKPGQHGSTFGGNPLACAVSLEALALLEEGKLAQHSEEKGLFLRNALREVQSPMVQDIRGMGLFTGIEIKAEYGTAKPYVMALMQEGILCKETHEQTIRLAPPLVISQEELEWAIPKLQSVFSKEP